MSVEERVANIESDMGHVLSTLADVKNETKELRTELHSFKIEVGKEFASVRGEIADARAETAGLRTEMTKEFGLVRQEIASARFETVGLRTEMVKEFGLVRTELAKVQTTIERTKLWFVLIGLGALWSVVSGVAHALKLF